ncbi:unnamed protein product [Amoebophrya sp. A25]|nr:unnamed protein product [Amoebophrya sp. A25]|eukprot:GSA25T00011514001.1
MSDGMGTRCEGFYPGARPGRGLGLLMRNFTPTALAKLAVKQRGSGDSEQGQGADSKDNTEDVDVDAADENASENANDPPAPSMAKRRRLDDEVAEPEKQEDVKQAVVIQTLVPDGTKKQRAPVVSSISGPAFHDCKGDPVFTFGNYATYYNYRTHDGRLEAIAKHLDLRGKHMLDVGCNVGDVTSELARRALFCSAAEQTGAGEKVRDTSSFSFSSSNPEINIKAASPPIVVGCDIDASLIAKAACRHLYPGTRDNAELTLTTESSSSSSTEVCWRLSTPFFDVANFATATHDIRFSKRYGLTFHERVTDGCQRSACCARGPNTADDRRDLLFNVVFAFSITKWVHYQFGDAGLQRFFDQIYMNLADGGHFVLEPQPFSSYRKKMKLTAEIEHRVSNEIQLHPGSFVRYLTEPESLRPPPAPSRQTPRDDDEAAREFRQSLCLSSHPAAGGFVLLQKIPGKSLSGGFDRDILIFTKRDELRTTA